MPCQYRDALGTHRAGLNLPRCRIAGIQARQAAGMAGSVPLRPCRTIAPGEERGRSGQGAAGARRAACDHVRARFAQTGILAIAHPPGRATRRLRGERPQAGRDVSHRPSGALSAALQCSPQAGARAPLRGGRHRSAGLDRSRRRIAAGPCSGERIGQDHRCHARPESAHRRQHGIPGASRRGRIDGDNGRCRRRGFAGSAGVGSPPGALEGARRPSRKQAPERASPWSTSPRPCARNSTIRKT